MKLEEVIWLSVHMPIHCLSKAAELPLWDSLQPLQHHEAPMFYFLTSLLPSSLLQSLIVFWLILDDQISK